MQPGQELADRLLVNGQGLPWIPESLTRSFNEVRNAANGGAGIAQPAIPERTKHLHDCRGTFVTKLCRASAGGAKLIDGEIADIVGWSPENVGRIRRTYVDDAAVVVALSKRINRAL